MLQPDYLILYPLARLWHNTNFHQNLAAFNYEECLHERIDHFLKDEIVFYKEINEREISTMFDCI